MGVYWKIQFLGGITRNQYVCVDCLKRGDGVFEGGLIPKRKYVLLLMSAKIYQGSALFMFD